MTIHRNGFIYIVRITLKKPELIGKAVLELIWFPCYYLPLGSGETNEQSLPTSQNS